MSRGSEIALERVDMERAGEDIVPSDEPLAAERRGPGRKLAWWRGLLIAVAVLALAFWATASWVDRTGWHFFHTGKDVAGTLAQMAAALHDDDLDAFASHLGADYDGELLGLADLRLGDDRDGVRSYLFHSGGETADRRSAAGEWRDYVAGFDEVEEVMMFVHRLDAWRDPQDIRARVRFELIGTPAGEPRSGIDRAIFHMRFARAGDKLELRAATLAEGGRVISAEPHFIDVAADAGVDFENRYYPAFLDQDLAFGMLRYGPAGITAADVDNDGYYDLFVPDGVEAKLFRNTRDGRFEDVTAAAGLAGLDGVSVALFADYDNDGFKDAFISRTFQPNQLFHADGAGADGIVTYTDVTPESGIGEDCCTTVGSWADVNHDGFLDLYLGRYLDARETIPTTFYARNGEPNQLYLNRGDGTFVNVTEEAGVGEVGLCLGSVFGDYDNDGDADLYVVNDFGRKTLYRNDGGGNDSDGNPGVPHFTDVTIETGTLAYGAGMSASFGDYDNDGHLDIYVAHIRSEGGWFAMWPTVTRYMLNSWRQGVWVSDMPLYLGIMRQSGLDFVKVFEDMAAGNTLLHNGGDGTFEDVSWAAGANPPGWFWGSGFADFDNDGWQDVYAANGWVYNDPGTEIELDFLNDVVSRQDEYKTGAYFDPANFGNDSWHGWERNRHLRSRGPDAGGRVTFEEIGRATGTDLLLNSRGTAVADYWNRGVLDVAVAASTGRHALLRNQVGDRRDWLAVELIGGAGVLENGTNRDAVGARVTIRAVEQIQMREVALGDGYGSQNSLRLYFGLGGPNETPEVDELMIKWPRSGVVQHFFGVAANRIVEIREWRHRVVEKNYESVDQEFDTRGDNETGS